MCLFLDDGPATWRIRAKLVLNRNGIISSQVTSDVERAELCIDMEWTNLNQTKERNHYFARNSSMLTLFLPLLLAGAVAPAQEAVFGTTVVIPGGLKGDIYHVPEGSESLAVLRTLKPVGSIYASALNVPSQDFSIGFPGVTDRFEWFAIDYNGNFWIEQPGVYRFKLISDDASMVYIDGLLVIDNDGIHSPAARRCSVRLTRGVHYIRVLYMQGPRHGLALTLEVAGPNETKARIFSTEEFKPPGNPEEWRLGDSKAPQAQYRDLDREVPDKIPAPKKRD